MLGRRAITTVISSMDSGELASKCKLIDLTKRFASKGPIFRPIFSDKKAKSALEHYPNDQLDNANSSPVTYQKKIKSKFLRNIHF